MSTAPDFDYSTFYYPEIVAAVLAFKLEKWPEHTETDEHDPAVQLLQLYSLLAHMQAARLDHTARELYLPTLRLRSSLIAQAALLSYDLDPPAPAEGDLWATLGGALSAPGDVVKAHSLWATRSTTTDVVIFEFAQDTPLQAGPTGSWTLLEYEASAYSVVTGSLPLTLWSGGVAVNDALVVRSGGSVMFDRLDVEIDSDGSGYTGRWEYRDDSAEGPPDLVTDLSGSIQFRVSSVVGPTNATGLSATVTCQLTGRSETVALTWTAGPSLGHPGYNLLTPAGTLGQSTVSTNAADYTITADWIELGDLDDETSGLKVGGRVTWSTPQDADRRWVPSDVGGQGGDDYEVRFRITAIDGPTEPSLAAVDEAPKTKYSVLFEVQQGQRVEDKIGTTVSGIGGQTFDLTREPFMAMVSVTVGGEAWTEIGSFLEASSIDKVYTLREQPDGTWRLTFGDGTNGRIPPAPQAVVATYRVGGGASGNVGADSITRDRSGNRQISAVTNPRAMTGWLPAEAATPASLEVARESVPASLRTLQRAVTPSDVETLALAFEAADGTALAVRALSIEEGSGPKTQLLRVVGPAGVAPTAEDLAELEAYYNGEYKGLQRVGGVLLANQEVEAVAYTPKLISVSATVEVLADYATDADDDIEAHLLAKLHPTATRTVLLDGTWVDSGEWLWEWGDNGGKVSEGVIKTLIGTSVSGVLSITLSGWSDVLLAAGELPTSQASGINITVVSV